MHDGLNIIHNSSHYSHGRNQAQKSSFRMCGTTPKYSLTGPFSIVDPSQNHAAMWSGEHTVRGAQYALRGSEAEVYAGGHGMVLNLIMHTQQ